MQKLFIQQPNAKLFILFFEVVDNDHCWKLYSGLCGDGSDSVHQFLHFLKLDKMLKLPSAGLLL